jgi:hypothetical protein
VPFDVPSLKAIQLSRGADISAPAKVTWDAVFSEARARTFATDWAYIARHVPLRYRAD